MNSPAIKNANRWWSWEDVLLIVFLAAALYLPGLGQIPLFDRDEPRFAEAAREMVLSGNFIVPRFDGMLRPDKPPLVYWFMSASYKLFDISGFSARLPSVVFGVLTLLVVYWMTGKRFGRATGVLAALMLSVAVLFLIESRLATADSTLVFFTTLCMACLWTAWDARAAELGENRLRPKAQLLYDVDGGGILNQPESLSPSAGTLNRVSIWSVVGFWTALALGILAKGVAPIFVFSTMITLSLCSGGWRQSFEQWQKMQAGEKFLHFPGLIAAVVMEASWRWWGKLKPILGIFILCILIVPWPVLAWVQTNGDLIRAMLHQNVVSRTTTGLEHHGRLPGFYLVMIWGIFWPWSVLLIPAAFHTVRRIRGKTPVAIDPTPYQFLLAWIIPSWIIFELIVTKMPEYILPLFIPMIILCADTLVQSWHRLTDVLAAKWFGVARWIWLAIWIALAGALAVMAWRIFIPSDVAVFKYIALAAAAILAAGIAGAISWKRPTWPFVTVLTFGIALLIINGISLPSIPQLQINRQAGQQMQQMASQGYQLAAAGYTEPSVVFYAGGNVQLFGSADDLLKVVPFPPRKVVTKSVYYCVLVNQDVLNDLERRHVEYFFRNSFDGLNEAQGRPIQLTLITNINPLTATNRAGPSTQLTTGKSSR
ncbi:MAG TPA: glycosyltransferase family 39 protein [Phycisphaerae bacterium]|nr:glycosyltransferase family 39 protein [Phycisphaerae bacterium]